MRTDLTDAIDDRINKKFEPPQEGTIVGVFGRYARVRLKGSSQTKMVECTDNGEVEAGKSCIIQWLPKSGKYVMINVSSRNATSDTGMVGRYELYPPENLTADDALPDNVILSWDAPLQLAVSFEIQTNTSAIEAGATTIASTRGSFLIHQTSVPLYYRVRSVSTDYRYSGYTDWLLGTPGEALTDIFQSLDPQLTALANATGTGFVEYNGDGTVSLHPQPNSYGAPVGDLRRSWFDTATITHEELSEVVGAVVTDLQTMEIFGIIPPPIAPTITAPTEDECTTDTTPTITWDAVSGDNVTYNVEIYSDIGLSVLEESSYDQVGLSFTSPTLADDDYYVVVWAESDGGVGPNSAVRHFQVLQLPAVPDLVSPTDGAYLDPIVHATGVDLTLGLEANATSSSNYFGYDPSNVFDDSLGAPWWASSGSGAPHWVQIDLGSAQEVQGWSIFTYETPGQNYKLQYWNGSTWIDASAVESPTFSDWSFYPLSSPITAQLWRYYMTSSSNGWGGILEAELLVYRMEFQWDAADRADSYLFELTLASDPTFAAPIISDEVFVTEYFTDQLSSVNDYIWRVTPINCSGSGTASATWDLHIQSLPVAPTLTFPDDLRWIQDFRLEDLGFAWSDLGSTADNYQIQVTDTSGDYSSPIVDDDTLTDPEYFPTAGEVPALATPYYWRVRAENETGWGEWSDEFEVFVTDPVWEYLAADPDLRVYWMGRDADALLMRATNPYVAEGRNILHGNDSTMSGANNWTGTNLGTFNINSTVAGKMYMLGDGGGDTSTINGVLVLGKAYKATLKARLASGGSTANRIGTGTTAGSYVEFTPTGTEATFSGYFIATSTALSIGLATGFNGVAFEIDDVVVQQVNIRASTDFPYPTGRLNIVTNWEFSFDYAWTKAAGVTIAGGAAVLTAAASGNALVQTVPSVVGKQYVVSWDVTVTSGSVRAILGSGGAAIGATISTSQHVSETLTCLVLPNINFNVVTTFTGTIDNVTIVPLDNLLVFNGDGSTTTGWSATNATLSSVSGWLRVARVSGSVPDARQANMIIGRRYRVTGIARSDGSAIPTLVTAGAVWTGTNSTSNQAFDVQFIATTTSFQLRSATSTGTEYTEWQSVVMVEVNPLDALLVNGATVVSGLADAMGGSAIRLDGSNDYMNALSAELNSLFTPQELWIMVGVSQDNPATALQETFLRLVTATFSHLIMLRHNITTTHLNGLTTTAAGNIVQSYTGSGRAATEPFLHDMFVDFANTEQSSAFNGVEYDSDTLSSPVEGNISIAVLGAQTTGAAAPLDGDFYFAALLNKIPTDAERLGVAQLLELD